MPRRRSQRVLATVPYLTLLSLLPVPPDLRPSLGTLGRLLALPVAAAEPGGAARPMPALSGRAQLASAHPPEQVALQPEGPITLGRTAGGGGAPSKPQFDFSRATTKSGWP